MAFQRCLAETPLACIAMLACLAHTAFASKSDTSDVQFNISCTFFGSCIFFVALMYLMKNKDDRIRAYSWDVMSHSTSVFVGQSMIMAFNGCLNFYIVGSDLSMLGIAGHDFKLVLVFSIATLLNYFVLQFVLAYVSGTIGPKSENLDSTRLNLKCWAVMIGMVMTGSSINLWAHIQNRARDWIAGGETYAIFLSCLCMFALFKLVGHVRLRIIKDSADSAVSENEQLWNDYTRQIEGTVFNVTTAFLIIQVVRCSIAGALPLPTGAIPPGVHIPRTDAAVLGSFSLGFFLLIIIFDRILPEPSWFKRLKAWCKGIAGNCCAFCQLYTIAWLVSNGQEVTTIYGHLGITMCASFFAILVIFVLDKLLDMPCFDEEFGDTIEKEVNDFIGPLATLVGFAWKQTFIPAMSIITAKVDLLPDALETLCVSAAFSIVVLPAWRWYIVPTVLENDKASEKSTAAKIEASRSKNNLEKSQGYQPINQQSDSLEKGIYQWHKASPRVQDGTPRVIRPPGRSCIRSCS